jgi:hypothetical protein
MSSTVYVKFALIIVLLGAYASNVKAQAAHCDNPANPIVVENCQTGTDEWFIEQPDAEIEGFVYPPSVNIGETVRFYVNIQAAKFELRVYRSGYYAGTGGRLILTQSDIAGGTQPTCNQALYDTGLVSCSNWSPSLVLQVPTNWVSGVYIARFINPQTGGANAAVFVVRDDARVSDILVQQSLFTYHAYSSYGGKSLYSYNSGWDADYCNTVTTHPRAAQVSLFRPLSGGGANVYWQAEYPMVRWLEQQGYDVTYNTNLDTHRDGLPGAQNRLLNHHIFLSVGHDEYWTQELRDAITAARDAGVHMGFFSANTGYWRVRLEPDPWTGEPDSVIASYKTTEAGIPDPSGQPTTTFRDPAGVNDPENALIGVQYIGDNSHFGFPLRITHEHGIDRIYRHTDLQAMPEGTFIDLGGNIFSWEWDAVTDNGQTPAGLEILSETPVFGLLLQDAGNPDNGAVGTAGAHTTRYIAESGAIVFASGTIQWSWGLGAQATTVVPVEPYIQQITYNVLADMGVQPTSPVSDIILDGEDGIISSPPERFQMLTEQHFPTIAEVEVDTAADLIDSGRSVVIRWQTDVPTAGQVWLGIEPTDPHIAAAQTLDYSTDHTLQVIGLVAGANYYLRVAAVTEDGNFSLSDQMSFQTPTNLIHVVGSPLLRTWRSVECWAHDYPLGVVGVGGGMFLVVASLGGLLIRRRLLRKSRLSQQISRRIDDGV